MLGPENRAQRALLPSEIAGSCGMEVGGSRWEKTLGLWVGLPLLPDGLLIASCSLCSVHHREGGSRENGTGEMAQCIKCLPCLLRLDFESLVPRWNQDGHSSPLQSQH